MRKVGILSVARGLLTAAKLYKIKTIGQVAQEAIFLPFHSAPRRCVMIVVSSEVEQAVDEVARQFRLPGGVKPVSLDDGFIDADDDLTVQPGRRGSDRVPAAACWFGFARLGVIEGNHVSRAFMVQKGFVEMSHLARGDEIEAEVILIQFQQVLEDTIGRLAKEAQIDPPGALPIADSEFASCRCAHFQEESNGEKRKKTLDKWRCRGAI